MKENHIFKFSPDLTRALELKWELFFGHSEVAAEPLLYIIICILVLPVGSFCSMSRASAVFVLFCCTRFVTKLRRLRRLHSGASGASGARRVRRLVGFGPVGWASRLPALILGSQDHDRTVQKDGPGRGIGRQGPGKGPGAPNLTISTIFEPGRAVSLRTVWSSRLGQ